MREYKNRKTYWKNCYSDDEKAYNAFNWNLYEHKTILDNSLDATSTKLSINSEKKISEKPNNWRIAYVPTTSYTTSNIEQEFNVLARKWKSETGLFSIDRDRVNDTLLDILTMGKEIIPFILKDMQKPTGTARWHIALKALSRINPISINELNKSQIIKDKWIKWGKENNLI